MIPVREFNDQEQQVMVELAAGVLQRNPQAKGMHVVVEFLFKRAANPVLDEALRGFDLETLFEIARLSRKAVLESGGSMRQAAETGEDAPAGDIHEEIARLLGDLEARVTVCRDKLRECEAIRDQVVALAARLV